IFLFLVFFFQAEDGIRDATVTGVQTCALPISSVVTTNNPRAVPTQTPSGAGARASGLSSSNSLIREPAASILTTPRSHASQSDRPLAIRRRPSTHGNPSVPAPSIAASAERSAATQLSPRTSPTST